MSESVDLKEFVTGFLLEADEHLHSVNQNLVATSESLKSGRANPKAVRDLFRSLHTIKGLSAMVGADPIVDISHEMESILREADRAGGKLTENELDLLMKGTRALEERVHLITKGGISALTPAPESLMTALTSLQGKAQSPVSAPTAELELPAEISKALSASEKEQLKQALSANRQVYLIDFLPSPEKVQAGVNITAVRDRLKKLGDLIKVIPHAAAASATGIAFWVVFDTDLGREALKEKFADAGLVIEPICAAVSVTASGASVENSPVLAEEIPTSLETASEWTPPDQSSIRVTVKKLDEAMERLSALVVTRSKMALAIADLGSKGVDVRELGAVLADNTRELKRLRTAITQARMVPLSELLQRLPLVVRGLTQGSGKSVNLEIRVGSAEVDKAVADKLFPAIVHIIRNAVDHAVEPIEERRRLKKPEAGTITISCDGSSGTNVILSIQDDGRGISREAVARKAGMAVSRNDVELLEQIATPGLSTQETVSQTSGRGMGMDIVKRSIELLGGMLNLRTEEGKGTTFTIRVPLSVTIVDVLSFVSGGQVFVVPLAMVDEILEVDATKVARLPSPDHQKIDTHLIQRRGLTLPLLSLSALLQQKKTTEVAGKALVVHQAKGAIAFAVDRMLGQQEVVVRPLDCDIIRVPGMAGATDLGDGKPTLVLDLVQLGASVLRNTDRAEVSV